MGGLRAVIPIDTVDLLSYGELMIGYTLAIQNQGGAAYLHFQLFLALTITCMLEGTDTEFGR